MSRLSWLPEVALATGYPVVEVEDWQDRGYSDGYNPSSVVAHHTAGPSGNGDMPSLGLCVNGRSDLPGPLANYCLGRSGTIYVVASGKANNAGEGDWKSCDSNYCTVGIEAENDGSQPWPDVQLDSYARLVAGILDRLGRSAEYACGHKEWAPGRKVDPHSINMDRARATVQSLLDQGGDLPLNDEDKEWIKGAIRSEVSHVLGGGRETWQVPGESGQRTGNRGVVNSVWAWLFDERKMMTTLEQARDNAIQANKYAQEAAEK